MKEKECLNIWDTVQAAIQRKDPQEAENQTTPDIWDRIRKHEKNADYCPMQSQGAEAAVVTGRHGKTSHMLRSSTNKYLSLGEEEFFLWQLMNGQHTVLDLNMEYIDQYGKMGQNVIASLLVILRKDGFLCHRAEPIYEILQRNLYESKLPSKLKRTFALVIHSSINIKKIDPYFSNLYRKFGFFFYKKPVQIISFLLLAADLILFSYYVFVKHETMLLFSSAGSHDVIFFMVASYFCVFVHENAHGLTVKHFERQVRKGGFLVMYGNPIPYVDTTDIWMKDTPARIAVSFAGPFVNGILGGIFLLATLPVPESLSDNILTHLGLLNSLQFIVNLIPIIETDGHYILQDWFEEPRLRQNALDFVKRGMWKKLLRREKWHKRDIGYLIYGLITVFGIVYMIYVGIHLWLYTLWYIVDEAIRRPTMLVEILIGVLILILIVSTVKFGLFRGKVRLQKAIEEHLASAV